MLDPIPLSPTAAQDSFTSPFRPIKSDPDLSILSCTEEISCFHSSILSDTHQVWTLKDRQYLTDLINRDYEHLPNPYYFQTIQPYITSTMRSILYDWMMEVCSELTLKRETFQLSVNYCDRYSSRYIAVKKEEYQLVGLACMCLAAKVEEVLPPALVDWAVAADNGYEVERLEEMERLVLRTIDFKVMPATAFNWLSWLMTQWDRFVDFHFGCVPGNCLKEVEKGKAKTAYDERMILFKQANKKAYKRYRETMQILDVACLHEEFMQFTPRLCACGLMYLAVHKYLYESNYTMLYFIGEEIDRSEFRSEGNADTQVLFEKFVKVAAEIYNIEEIYESINYFHRLLQFEVNCELPVVCKVQSKAKLESHYEDFLAFQTHNTKNLDFVLKEF